MMDYESIDREMSTWLVSCKMGTTRFFLTPEETATDILSRAARFRWFDQANDAAGIQREASAWQGGFDWQPISRPAASLA